MHWVTEFCNRAILVERGRIIMEGDPEEVVALHREHSERAKIEREAEVARHVAAAVRAKEAAAQS
jgi:ABC-type glutathione transport system ATPase component